MSQTTFADLPLDSLYELFLAAVKDMLSAFDEDDDNLATFRARRKQVDILFAAIEGKRSHTSRGTSPS